MKKIKYLLFPLVIVGVFCSGLNSYLNRTNVKMMNEKDLFGMLYDMKSMVKDKGYYANEYLTDKGYILMMGSSELSHSTKQHPDLFFNTGRTKHGVITSGRAYTQDLLHASMVGSLDNSKKNKKVVLLLSMQWFMEKDGERPDRFQSRFSPVIFYRYMTNPKISRKTKKEYASRVAELLKGTGDFKEEELYARLYSKDSGVNRIIKLVMSPYFKVREYMVRLKDKGILYSSLVLLPEKRPEYQSPIDWNYERQRAIDDAKFRVGKKPPKFNSRTMFVDKGYFREYLNKKEKYFKNLYAGVDLKNAKEYDDYKIFLETCRQTGVEPTIVLIPVIDDFYDYVGIDKNERAEYFSKIKSITEPYGYRVLDESNSGSSRYYLRDVMHLGTLGWTDVCHKIYDIYEK